MSGLLLDTHILLWYFQDNPDLKLETSNLLENPNNALYINIVSLWEIAIMINIGKLNIEWTLQDLLALLRQFSIEILPLTPVDLQFYLTLPLHHRDPFDRILVAQANNNSLVLISYDKIFDLYFFDK